MLFENPYECYLYSYPHKTAYRELPLPLSLQQAVAGKKRREAHLYMHIPFCQSRCGYCNLFTTIGTDSRDYLHSLRRHAYSWQQAGATETFRFLSFAIGGGTPLLLDASQLQELFDIARKYFHVNASRTPVSIETAPRQTTRDRLAVLKDNQTERISIGVQSFHNQELKTLNRNHLAETAQQALELLKHFDFPVLNIDLIYGIPGQTNTSFLRSLKQATSFVPQEIFLYPLYIRPSTYLGNTTIDGRQNSQDIHRLYLTGREYLLSQGYIQTSMRRFTLCADDPSVPEFSCSEENMISLGCGGRSYIGNLHFSEHYAVGQTYCRKILQDYIQCEDYAHISHGFFLSEPELKRRFLIKNLLYYKGLDIALYTATYGTLPDEDFPLLHALLAEGLCICDGNYWKLTPQGMGYSDAIGPAFISNEVKHLMQQWKES